MAPKGIVPQRTLYDIRDNNSYTVRKLADGNCWMTDSLRLALTDDGTSSGNVITVEAASNTSRTVMEGGYTPTKASSGIAGVTSSTSYVSTTGQYYYNWWAATAESNTSVISTPADASYSICPLGWRLPANYTIIPDKSYNSITDTYGFTPIGSYDQGHNYMSQLASVPLSFTHSGSFDLGSLHANGDYGYYWSSTSEGYDSYNKKHLGYDFRYHSGATNPIADNQKIYGMLVRCVAL